MLKIFSFLKMLSLGSNAIVLESTAQGTYLKTIECPAVQWDHTCIHPEWEEGDMCAFDNYVSNGPLQTMASLDPITVLETSCVKSDKFFF